MNKKFTAIELRDLFGGWIGVSLIVMLALGGANRIQAFWMSALTVGIAFIVHELAHKFTAQHYKKYAEFQANYLLIGGGILLAALTGVIIAAPGAVIISGFVSRKQNGLIAAAGPISNIVLALLALPALIFTTGLLQTLFTFSFLVNGYLALFNLIPFGVFDGAKIISWNKPAYFALAITSAILIFIGGVFSLTL